MVLRIIGASRTVHVKKLLTSHDRSGLTPLMIAAQNGNSNILSILIQSGAQVNAKSLSTNKSALMFAAFHGHLSVVQILDRAGAEWDGVDRTGCNVLHHAVNGGNLRIVLYILDRTGKSLIDEKDDSGWTPLMRAIVVGRSTEVVKLLLLRGADPNATDKVNSKSCLMAAALLGKHEMVTQLLLSNADPAYINANDKSIIDVSGIFGSEAIKNQIAEALNKSTGPLREELKKSGKFRHLLESIIPSQPHL
jgi:ankyrin repeat protein